ATMPPSIAAIAHSATAAPWPHGCTVLTFEAKKISIAAPAISAIAVLIAPCHGVTFLIPDGAGGGSSPFCGPPKEGLDWSWPAPPPVPFEPAPRPPSLEPGASPDCELPS